MTKSKRGSSLPQARSYHHNHYHLHNKRAASSENVHHHHRRQVDEAEPSPTPESAPSAVASQRVVVQTVSLIQIVDGSGAPIEVQTHYAPPATVFVDPSPSASASAALGLSIAAIGPDSSSLDESLQSTPAATTPSPSPSGSAISQEIPLTTGPSSSLPASAVPSPYLSLSAPVNSTIPFLTSTNSSSTSVLTATSSTSLFSGSTSVTSSVLSSLSSTFDSTLSSDSFTATNTFATSTSTGSAETTAAGDGGNGGVGGVGGGGQTTPSSTSGASSSSDTSTPSTGTVVGSVVGSVAGVAFIVLLAFLALRWKKSSGGRLRLSDNSANGNRGILTGSGAPDGGNNGGMTQQRSLTFGSAAVAGAVAAAKPPSRRASEPSETAERGFVRVAGRKLPSVLQSGGDGYTDPREAAGHGTANDDESVYYRDSQAFFDPNGQGPPRLALGSPMRPVSGVITMQPGPARTPVTESAPFPTPPPDSTLSPLQAPARDPIGRSLTSQDGSRGSRGSASRFHEAM
nr:uncharacterized protein CTRU02_06993 [Colletotrichum truncatum]KAF6791809.1 hypothetical protein CTRU02_06993 [Colletotrichum truncatum]